MQQLTNEEKAKVFAMYLLAPMYFHIGNDLETESVKPKHIYALLNGTPKSRYFRMYLTPLSGITDEHNNEVEAMFGEILLLNHIGSLPAISGVYLYLISKGYDVPQWFGVGHPCNGMTAIQLGIAIDKTKI